MQRTLSDITLLHQLKAGKPSAVSYWFTKYHQPVVTFIGTKVSEAADAEELAQEVFINCLRQLPLFRGDSQLWTWMQSIARHEIADYYRKRYAKKAIKALPLGELLDGLAVANAQETSHQVKHVIQQLSHETQELLLLKYVDNKKVAEIAQMMGKTTKAVEAELYRARVEFKQVYAVAGAHAE
ncbi:MAG: sigma-70 family RNA polymerase sigma factor [bacterium]|nr:sigma-70 family RNA polymerase sigma factor [bacterium]